MSNRSCAANLEILGYRVVISREIQDPSWDAFVSGNPSGQFEQTSAWAHAKSVNRWRPLRLSLFSNGNIVGGAQILYRNVLFFGKIAYISKGPVVTPGLTSEITRRILGELTHLVKKERILYLVVQLADNSHFLEDWLLDAGFHVDS